MCVELDMKGIHVACICILVQVHAYYLQSLLLKSGYRHALSAYVCTLYS